MPRRKVTHAEFWEAYHFLTDPIKPRTKLAPYWSDEEIEMLCEIQVRLRELMDERDTFKPTPMDDTPYNLLDYIEQVEKPKRKRRYTKRAKQAKQIESGKISENDKPSESVKWVM